MVVEDMDNMVVDELAASDADASYFQWSPVIAGAITATAFSFILVTFAVAIGLGVSSTSPSWRDASGALALLSGIYLILQAIISFGIGGYIAGRTYQPLRASAMDDVTRRDGLHGLAAWALAVLIGASLAALVGAWSASRASSTATMPNATSAEPLLSYELDKLFRSARRPANVDVSAERAEAGRILMTSSSHTGVSSDDKSYLAQQVAATTGLAQPDADRRVDRAIADSKTAIARSRRNTVIVAFSIAAATLLGAVASWVAACAGGKHRDGAPLPNWMEHANNAFERRKLVAR
jgi:hypothetical protein